jgi:hypothetical protein
MNKRKKIKYLEKILAAAFSLFKKMLICLMLILCLFPSCFGKPKHKRILTECISLGKRAGKWIDYHLINEQYLNTLIWGLLELTRCYETTFMFPRAYNFLGEKDFFGKKNLSYSNVLNF